MVLLEMRLHIRHKASLYLVQINSEKNMGRNVYYCNTVVRTVAICTLLQVLFSDSRFVQGERVVRGDNLRHETDCSEPLLPADGLAVCTGHNKNDTCKFACYEGYYYHNNDHNSITCLCDHNNSSCSWSAEPAKCIPLKCHDLLYDLTTLYITGYNQSRITTNIIVRTNISVGSNWGVVIFFSSNFTDKFYMQSDYIRRSWFCGVGNYMILWSGCGLPETRNENDFEFNVTFHGITPRNQNQLCGARIAFVNFPIKRCCYDDEAVKYLSILRRDCYITTALTTVAETTHLPTAATVSISNLSTTSVATTTGVATTPPSYCWEIKNTKYQGFINKKRFTSRGSDYRLLSCAIKIPRRRVRYSDWVITMKCRKSVNIIKTLPRLRFHFNQACNRKVYYIYPKNNNNRWKLHLPFYLTYDASSYLRTCRIWICIKSNKKRAWCDRGAKSNMFEAESNNETYWTCDDKAPTGHLPQTSHETQPHFKTYYGKLLFNPFEVLHKSILFFEAQQSGKLSNFNRIPWRGTSSLKDGCVCTDGKQRDLTGGWYNGGFSMKFNFPMAASATLLAWGGIEFDESYLDSQEFINMLNQLYWVADYLVKCHTSKNELWGQVGTTMFEFSTWTRPEENTNIRMAYKIDSDSPGSDLAGEVSAALSAIALLIRDIDEEYSKILQTHAQELYNFSNSFRGSYHDVISDVSLYYKSWDGYGDELVWSCIWLWKLTNDSNLLKDCEAKYFEFGFDKTIAYEFSWSNKIAGAQILLYEATKKQKYLNDVLLYVKGFLKNKQTPTGLRFYSSPGSNKYAANFALICLMIAKQHYDQNERRRMINLAISQINPLVGDREQSYVVGYGRNPPTQPHHSASSCPKWNIETYKRCSWRDYFTDGPNKHILYGALVGGPINADGEYHDKRSDYKSNVVSCDNNAGFQSAVAGLHFFVDIDNIFENS